MAAVMILTACQMMPEQSAPKPASKPAPAQYTREQLKNREAQAGLKKLGCYKGRVDGIIGPHTVAAIKRCRADLGLDPEGGIDQKLLDTMNRYLELNPPRKGVPVSTDVFAAQRGLKKLGYYNGPVNGLYDTAIVAAMVGFQRKNGLPVNRNIDANLLNRIKRDADAIAN
ncbi:MAG TPA: peptidoglycan-binding domain-containing protein [Thermohalobaculum sp.]|nr:peptidoglycan-binding domain-containing protein [Thermohalobaculum sp.]